MVDSDLRFENPFIDFFYFFYFFCLEVIVGATISLSFDCFPIFRFRSIFRKSFCALFFVFFKYLS